MSRITLSLSSASLRFLQASFARASTAATTSPPVFTTTEAPAHPFASALSQLSDANLMAKIQRYKKSIPDLVVYELLKRESQNPSLFQSSVEHLATHTPTVATSQQGLEIYFKLKQARHVPRHEINALLKKQTTLLAPDEITPSIFPAHLTGEALLQPVHEFTKQGHEPKSYREAQRAIFSTIDRVIINGVTGVYCAYSEIFVPGEFENGGDFDEDGDLNGDGYVDRDGMNVEHLWAQSYFEKHLPMRSDVHHLLATFMHPNGMRGRLPFGNIPEGAEIRYRTSAGAKATSTHFEPPDSAKGDVARAMFYFFARYYDQDILPKNVLDDFWHNSIETLMEWNRQHPPDAWEIQRNQRIQAFQGNFNPFVLDLGLIDRIGASAFHFSAREK